MPITLKLSPEIEMDLRQEAARSDMGVETFASNYFSRSWNRSRRRKSSPLDILTPEEQDTIAKLNAQLPANFWQRYNELEHKISGGNFSEAEREEALELAQQSEAWNVRRLSAINEMAERHGMKFDELMHQLKIGHHPNAGTGH